MTAFRDAFVERYEKNWIPLAEALHPELGIGYGDAHLSDDSPLLSGLTLASTKPNEDRANLNLLQSFLLQKIMDAAAAGCSEIEIKDSELPTNSAIEESLPESFSVVVFLVSRSKDALSNDDFYLLFNGGQGPSSARALGRFCSSDVLLENLVRSALRKEEASDPEAVSLKSCASQKTGTETWFVVRCSANTKFPSWAVRVPRTSGNWLSTTFWSVWLMAKSPCIRVVYSAVSNQA